MIKLVFQKFRGLGWVRQVLLWMASQNVHFPYPSDGRTLMSFEWRPIRYRNGARHHARRATKSMPGPTAFTCRPAWKSIAIACWCCSARRLRVRVRGSSVRALELLGDLAHASERFHPCPLVLPDPQLWPIDRPQAGDKRMRRRLDRGPRSYAATSFLRVTALRVMALLSSRSHSTELPTAVQMSQSPRLNAVVENARCKNGV